MSSPVSIDHSLANNILDRVEALLTEAEKESKPLELEPYRGRLFELFVLADATGFLKDESEPDLSSDGIARELAQRWDLADATRESVAQQTKLPPEHLAKMRLMWSFMRLWVEWTYAWKRWNEFHDGDGPIREDH